MVLQGLQALADMGAYKRGIESEGITADRLQFEEERDFPYKQVQYMQSLIARVTYRSTVVSYAQPSSYLTMSGTSGGLDGAV